jgi:hypothetical protein
MNGSSDLVTCTVDNGSLWMHLDDLRVKISSSVVEKSQILKSVLSSPAVASSASDITLTAPKQWLRAWAFCFGSGETRLGSADNKDLVSCLLVRFFNWNEASLCRKPASSPASFVTLCSPSAMLCPCRPYVNTASRDAQSNRDNASRLKAADIPTPLRYKVLRLTQRVMCAGSRPFCN